MYNMKIVKRTITIKFSKAIKNWSGCCFRRNGQEIQFCRDDTWSETWLKGGQRPSGPYAENDHTSFETNWVAAVLSPPVTSSYKYLEKQEIWRLWGKRVIQVNSSELWCLQWTEKGEICSRWAFQGWVSTDQVSFDSKWEKKVLNTGIIGFDLWFSKITLTSWQRMGQRGTRMEAETS